MERPLCLWCHQYHDIMYEKMVMQFSRLGYSKGRETEFFCSTACFEKEEKFLKLCARFAIPTILLLALTIGAIFYSLRLSSAFHVSHAHFLGLVLVPLGILFQFVPYTTPETVRYVGMARGAWMTRGVGLMLFGISALVFFFG
ncbi:MAG: hypothetical protein A2636_03415 [Elusimicrobia bacterium RIFCSPHIGHO2_01_FULL_64_10]|nr:MAG: hypothetical protein A2636_03415 [Elusimicrobia bacterium RIFCSPHIGHO2_01_FULL_64_10]